MWYVVQTLKGRERRDTEGIKADVAVDGEDAFIFESERMFRIGGEWIKELKPLFPGYIFVSSKDIERFSQRLRRRNHNLRLLTVGGKITHITEAEEKYLRDIGGEDRIVRYSEGICIDDTVKITSGAFISISRFRRDCFVRGVTLSVKCSAP